MKYNEKRLHEVMGRLDKTFKSKLNEDIEAMEVGDDEVIPTDTGEEMPIDGEEGIEEKSPEEKLAELTAKVDEIYALLHGEEEIEEPAEELPDEPEAGEMEIETGEVNLQEWNFDKKKGDGDEGKGETPAEEKEEVDEDVTTTVTEKKGKPLSSDKAPEVEIGK